MKYYRRRYTIEFYAGAWEAWTKPGYMFPDGQHCKIIAASVHAGKAWKKEALNLLRQDLKEAGEPIPCNNSECEHCEKHSKL